MKVTEQEVIEAQNNWAEAIVKAGRVYAEEKRDLRLLAKKGLQILYGFGEREVLFKPTRARIVPFRSTIEEAISYFIGGEIKEDKGFATSQFQDIQFNNYKITIKDDEAFAIGHYTFINSDGSEIVAEYTLGYYRSSSGKLKIFLHHSSFPYAE